MISCFLFFDALEGVVFLADVWVFKSSGFAVALIQLNVWAWNFNQLKMCRFLL